VLHISYLKVVRTLKQLFGLLNHFPQTLTSRKINPYTQTQKRTAMTDVTRGGGGEQTPLSSHSDWGNVYLTSLNETDLGLICGWQNSPSIRDLTMGWRFPIQLDTAREWLKILAEQNSKSQVVFAIRLKNDLVGIISLRNIEAFQRKSLFGIYIGDTTHHNKGIGLVSTCLILDYAFNGLDLRKVSLEVIENNPTAISLFEGIGFKKEGTKRQEYFADGKYMDTRIYGILKEEFKLIIPKSANRLLHTF
jgi:diamine N-acetyltransferase